VRCALRWSRRSQANVSAAITWTEHGARPSSGAARDITDPDWQTASQALDDLMAKLVVMQRLLEAEERLPQRAAT
jgi:hypothetical protein